MDAVQQCALSRERNAAHDGFKVRPPCFEIAVVGGARRNYRASSGINPNLKLIECRSLVDAGTRG
jgi:hypothetical protein